MNLQEFLKQRRSKPEAYKLFLDHCNSQGPVKALIIKCIFFVSFTYKFEKIPMIGKVAQSVKSLFIGYCTETFALPREELTRTKCDDFSFDLRDSNCSSFDYIIIGSGPGAAIAAERIQGSGRILVLEKGDCPRTSAAKHHTLEHVRKDFEKAGQEFVVSTWLPQFAQASVFGGGSEVNSGLYHDLPEELVKEWCSQLGVKEERFLEAQTNVRMMLKLSRNEVGVENSIIARGAVKLGLNYQNIPRWRTYSSDTNYIQHGMNDVVWGKYGVEDGFSFRKKTKALRIDNSSKDSISVITENKELGIEVFKTKNIIMASGVIQTPYLLCKSDILKWRDTHFQWHPMIRAIVESLDSDLGLNDIDPFQAWTNNREFKFGSAVSTPGLLSVNLGRVIDKQEIKKLRSIYVSFVSSGRGGLVPGTSLPWYVPSKVDKANASVGYGLLMKLIHESGASVASRDGKIPKKFSTVHVFGSLPGGSGLYFDGTSRLKADERIQISDSSILPSGPGVNPQGPVMSICRTLVTP